MYALQDAIGEARLNEALRRYMRRSASRAALHRQPRAAGVRRRGHAAREAAAARRSLRVDHALRQPGACRLSSRARPDGRYEVTVTATVRKLRADGKGVETEVPLDDWIDVGIFGEGRAAAARDRRSLYLQKHHVTRPDVTVTALVDGPPAPGGDRSLQHPHRSDAGRQRARGDPALSVFTRAFATMFKAESFILRFARLQ